MKRISDIILGDLAMLMALGFVAMVIFMIPWLNPPQENDSLKPPGNLIVTAHWPASENDVDMWIMGPTEVRPVGYSNQSGKLFNLLRDDLGLPDIDINFENIFSRGLPDGEYFINLHCYRCYDSRNGPIQVTVDVKIKKDGYTARPVASTRVFLRAQGEEKTAMRFMIQNGEYVHESLHNVFRSLRSWPK